jgi:hypothetical protein
LTAARTRSLGKGGGERGAGVVPGAGSVGFGFPWSPLSSFFPHSLSPRRGRFLGLQRGRLQGRDRALGGGGVDLFLFALKGRGWGGGGLKPVLSLSLSLHTPHVCISLPLLSPRPRSARSARAPPPRTPCPAGAAAARRRRGREGRRRPCCVRVCVCDPVSSV